jgi:hypothetical protein
MAEIERASELPIDRHRHRLPRCAPVLPVPVPWHFLLFLARLGRSLQQAVLWLFVVLHAAFCIPAFLFVVRYALDPV